MNEWINCLDIYIAVHSYGYNSVNDFDVLDCFIFIIMTITSDIMMMEIVH
jgi:hypothetical protein